MKTITTQTAIGEIVRAVPATSRIFENLNIDYCCGGKKALAEACRTKGLDAATVIAMLSAIEKPANDRPTDVDAMTLAELCNHIQQVHHGYLQEELPRLEFMARKVAAVHGEHEPRLLELQKTFEAFKAEITVHTKEEDEIVFPAISKVEAQNDDAHVASFDLLTSVERLEHEHDDAGVALERFKTLTDNFTPPEWACNTFRAFYDGLTQLEKNMHQHVHKENNVLFPKVLAISTEKPGRIQEMLHETS